MAQYRFEVHKPSGRHNSSGAVAKAAYINRENFWDEQSGKRHDYGKNHEEEWLWSGMFVDKNFEPPAWFQDPQKLWNEVSKAEKRRDAQECQDAIANLPHELTLEQNKRWVTDFIRENLTRGTGRVVNVAFHKPSEHSDDRNFHCHMLWTLRAIGPDGFEKTKLPSINKEKLESLREKWAEHGARALEKAAEQENRPELKVEAERWRVGHLTLEKQREEALRRGDKEWAKDLDREPQKHMGPKATAMERDDVKTRKGDQNRQIKDWNKERAERNERAPDMPENLQGTGREIWEAYRKAPDAERFVKMLRDKDIVIARIDKQDVRNAAAEFAAETKGKYVPRYLEGEYVAVNAQGWVYRLNEGSTGDKPWNVKAFMKPLDGTSMPSLAQTREAVQQRWIAREKEPMDHRSNGKSAPEMRVPSPAFPGAIERTAVRAVGKTLDGVGKLLETILAPTLTPEQKRDGRIADAERRAATNEAAARRRLENDRDR